MWSTITKKNHIHRTWWHQSVLVETPYAPRTACPKYHSPTNGNIISFCAKWEIPHLCVTLIGCVPKLKDRFRLISNSMLIFISGWAHFIFLNIRIKWVHCQRKIMSFNASNDISRTCIPHLNSSYSLLPWNTVLGSLLCVGILLCLRLLLWSVLQ